MHRKSSARFFRGFCFARTAFCQPHRLRTDASDSHVHPVLMPMALAISRCVKPWARNWTARVSRRPSQTENATDSFSSSQEGSIPLLIEPGGEHFCFLAGIPQIDHGE